MIGQWPCACIKWLSSTELGGNFWPKLIHDHQADAASLTATHQHRALECANGLLPLSFWGSSCATLSWVYWVFPSLWQNLSRLICHWRGSILLVQVPRFCEILPWARGPGTWFTSRSAMVHAFMAYLFQWGVKTMSIYCWLNLHVCWLKIKRCAWCAYENSAWHPVRLTGWTATSIIYNQDGIGSITHLGASWNTNHRFCLLYVGGKNI